VLVVFEKSEHDPARDLQGVGSVCDSMWSMREYTAAWRFSETGGDEAWFFFPSAVSALPLLPGASSPDGHFLGRRFSESRTSNTNTRR